MATKRESDCQSAVVKSVLLGAGLTAKGRAKYNRATGSNLKAPVTGKVKLVQKRWPS